MKIAIYAFLALLLHSCGVFVKSVQSDYQIFDFKTSSFQVIENDGLSEMENQVIAYGINKRMTALGYQTGKIETDLLVHYQLYDASYKIKSFKQPSMGHHLNSIEYQPNQPTKSQIKRVKGPSLYISIYDCQNNTVVWRGYTAYKAIEEPRLLLASVYEVMNEFHLISDNDLLAKNTVVTKGF